MARTIRFHQLGGPEVLRIEDVPVGDPKPGDVRIKVAAIGVNRSEAMFRRGEMGPMPLPSTLGYEAVGTIDALGRGVDSFKVGERVATIPGLSMSDYGTYGETIFYRADMLAKVPENLTMEQAAAAWMQYLTAYAVIGVGHVQRGDAVLITAASSSVGLAAIEFVNAAGATAIATTRGKSKAEALRKHGAAHVIVTDNEDLVPAVTKITGGRGCRIVFDAVGGDTYAQLVDLTRPGGIIIAYGALAGGTAPLPLFMTMMKDLTVRGYALHNYIADPAIKRTVLDYIHRGLAGGSLKPVVDRVFAFDDMAEAHRYLESNAQFGKIVVKV